MKNKQLYCNHYLKESKKTSVYTYSLIGSNINLCKKCEKSLRKGIMEQIGFEAQLNCDKIRKCKNKKK